MFFFCLQAVKGLYLWAAGWSSHASASSLHQRPLLCRQKVVLHGFDQVVFARTAILDQGLFLHPLVIRADREEPQE